MKKMLKYFIFMMVLNLFVNYTVCAILPDSLGKLIMPGSTEYTDDNYMKVDGFGTTFKISSAEGAAGAAFCTKHEYKSPTEGENICTINDDWNMQIRAGVAAIIQKAAVNNSKITKEYLYTVYAINQFLFDKGATSVIGKSGQNVVEAYPTLAADPYYKEYINAANDAFDNAIDPVVKFSSDQLTFTLRNDEYISNEIIVDSDSDIEVSTSSPAKLNNIGNGKYTVSVSKDKVNIGEALSVELIVSAKKSVLQARNYSCGTYIDSTDYNKNGNTTEVIDYQTVTPANYNILNLTKTSKITGQIKINTSIIIKKLDENKALLPGVVLKIESEDNDYSQTITTNDKEIKLENLKFGKYIITEISAPEGYVKTKKPLEVILSETNLDEVVTLNNSLTRVEISKISSNDSKLLEGAVLQIQDKDGNVLEDKEGKKYEWTSTKEVHVITGLTSGTYYLVEISSPEGYELNKNKIEFKVDNEKEVVKVEMKNDIEVKVPNTLSSRSALLLAISMFDIFLGIGIIVYVKKHKIQE